MLDFEIAFYLYKMAAFQRILDSQYRAKAYYSAAMALDAYSTYVEKMYHTCSLREIPFVGKKIEKCIIEIIETGRLIELEEYEKRFHINDYSLLLSHGLSDQLIKKLFHRHITSAEQLLETDNSNELRNELSKREYSKVCQFVENYQKNRGKYLLSYGYCLGKEIIGVLAGIEGVEKAFFIGGIENGDEKITSIEIGFAYHNDWNVLINQLKKWDRIYVAASGEDGEITGNTKFGIPFRLQRVEEAGRYRRKKRLDIKGDLHAHTIWSDGIHSIEEMARAAQERGYEYLAITDHTVSMKMAHGLSEGQALDQIDKVREFNRQNANIWLLAGIEVDILADGSLDYSDEVLEQFDFVIAAIHSHMNQKPAELIPRLEKALSNPYVNILAHPTGRLLGRPGVLFCERQPYQIDIRTIITLCKKNNVVLEINCFPERLDLSKKNIMLAMQEGVKVSVGTDAHSLAHLCNMEYGVNLVSKAGLPADMVLNTYSYQHIIDFFANQRMKRCINENDRNILKRKDFSYYFMNNKEIMEGTRRIVGIDLTASEEKESGWAYLQGNYAKCKRIATDEDIIQSVEELRPDIVSIDSPLAYPKGRCCARKNCECSKFGILRESERMLRHFGIHIYPCLIDSMVNLTTRGMRLAGILRDRGYHVIESYPGVAQDVLEIPRKGKTHEQFLHLKQGLESFGLVGEWINDEKVSHDELDAVTSALVGYFYLNDLYIGMGNDDEDYLIVPRIQGDLLKRRIIVGLCGETGSGKTTIAEYLKFKYGLQTFRYSQVIAEKYQVAEKEKLQEVGLRISQNKEEQKNLTQYMIERMDSRRSYVIDGLRHIEDFDMLRDAFGDEFIFFFIECKYVKRYQRYNKLHMGEISKETFERINNHGSEIDIMMLRPRADYMINNDRSYTELWKQMDQFIKIESGGNM